MTDLRDFGKNIERFDEVVDRIEDGDTRRFYHLLIMACAHQMKPGTFLQALHETKEKMSK